jgi:ABC-type Fe3+-hydroxamate transport system substrate-binding protein
MRIVSLVPSLTELIIDFGLHSSLAGRTRFCIHPEPAVGEIPIIGGTKTPRLDKIRDLKPDLIIANKEENRKEDIDKLREFSTVFLTDIVTIEDALLTIYELGQKLNVAEKADELISNINRELEHIPGEAPVQVAYLIWQKPWMAAGRDTYIHSVLTRWKMDNVFNDERRYPKITLEKLARKNPDYILLSSEPFPFKEKHKKEIREACPDSNVLLVDGQWFSWYGSRMLPSFKKLNTLRLAIS